MNKRNLQLGPDKISSGEVVKKRRRKKKSRLSNLPSGVIQDILSRLPIRDAVRTSVLSSDWRYKWNHLPCLVFNNRRDRLDSNIDFDKIVEHVFFFHRGPVDKFKLSVRRSINSDDINRWILYLSRNSIKEFILDASSIRPFISNVFAFKVLTHLELSNCLLNPPWFFKGLRMLKSLHFRRVMVSPSMLGGMISCSPLLERVILSDLKDLSGEAITHLNIGARNLQFLIVRGGSLDLKLLKNTSSLVDVSIDIMLSSKASRNLLMVLFNLPRIERLTLGGSFLKFDAGSLAEKLPKSCPSLKYFSLSMLLNNVATAMLLLRSSPALEELEILVRQGNEQATNWLDDKQNCTLTKLRRLKLCGFSVSKAEVGFIQSLLLSSPSLQQLEIAVSISRQFSDFKLTLQQLELSFDMKRLEEVDISWTFDNQDSLFTQLRHVKLTHFSGAKTEVDLIRFMLTSLPVLVKLTLQPASTQVSWKLATLFANISKCNSRHAEIEFLDPHEDNLADLSSDSDSSPPSSSESDSSSDSE